jgi:hypothetical protein
MPLACWVGCFLLVTVRGGAEKRRLRRLLLWLLPVFLLQAGYVVYVVMILSNAPI